MQLQNHSSPLVNPLENIAPELIAQLDFCREDDHRIGSLVDVVGPHISTVVNRFYDQLMHQPGMRTILSRDDVNMTHLKNVFCDWLSTLLSGPYDKNYFEKRMQIGKRHVEVGMPQHYMVSAMEIMRREVERVVLENDPDDHLEALASLNKIVSIDLAIMLESYKRAYAALVQENERALVEVRLSRAERLAEIGRLAASLAHEIKNPLAGISGAIQIIRDEMSPEAEHREIIGLILQQINRLDAVVKDLLLYARPAPTRMSECDINAIVQRVLSAMRAEETIKRARITFTPQSEKATIYADESKIEQLVLNLVLNAAQAVEENGTIRLSTWHKGGWTRLVVEDDGCGMEEEVRERAFEPFFTTKSRGTGLGLPMCKNIVDDHAGRIDLFNGSNSGVRVAVELPGVPPAAQTESNT